MKNTITKNIITAAILFSPLVAFADIGATITKWTEWALLIVNFLLVLATLVFLWGIIKYVSAGGDAAKVKEARAYILWGLIGLAVMASVWAISRYLLSIFDVTGDTTIPTIEQGSGGIL